MIRSVLAAGLAVVMFPGVAAAENTPDGPATLVSERTAIVPGNGAVGLTGLTVLGPYVVVGWNVTVGPGGRAGTVRPQFGIGAGAVVGDPVELPAEPGTYSFPAPHIRPRGIGIVQTTGGHAIVTREACIADVPPESDPCRSKWVDIFREGQPDERDPGAQLSLGARVEPDSDLDFRGDLTEDRTDLRVSAAPAREADGRLRVEVTVTNAGALAADTPWLTAPALVGGRWEGACLPHIQFPNCMSMPLAPGETRVFVVRADAPEATSSAVKVSSEGPDLAPADNEASVAFAAAPAFDLAVAPKQTLSRGVKVQVRAVRAGAARVTVAFRVRGHTLKVARTIRLVAYTARTLTVHPAGAKLRSLRRAAKRGPVTAEITVRAPGAKAPVTIKTVVR